MCFKPIDYLDILLRTVIFFILTVFIFFRENLIFSFLGEFNILFRRDMPLFEGYDYVPIFLLCLSGLSVGVGFYKLVDRYTKMFEK